jgi:E3 ubiquitin-protein ligase HUWE1
LFQNNSHCRDFTAEGGLEILLDIYSLPMLPGDFAVSIASDSLSYLFRLISEVNSATTIKIILSRLRVALENASEFLDNDSPQSMIVDFIDLKGKACFLSFHIPCLYLFLTYVYFLRF